MKRRLVNTLGAIGYLFVLVQWMWALVIVGVPLAMQPGFQELFMPNTQPVQESRVSPRKPLPGPVQTVVIIGSILFAVGVTVYAAVSIPRMVGRTGQRLTRKAATKTVPIITHHKKITKKRERSLVERITWSIKAGIVLVPLLALAVPPSSVLALEHVVSIAFGLAVGALAVCSFGLQYLLAKIWRTDSQLVW